MELFNLEQQKDLIKLYQSGLNDYDVASLIHVGRDKLRKWRTLMKIPSKTTKKGLSSVLCPEILNRLRKGDTLTAIARQYNVGRTSISRLLDRCGIEYEINKRNRPDWIQEYKLTPEQQSIIIGEMFGDGHIQGSSENVAYYYCGHCREQLSFVLWKFFKFRPISSRIYFGTSTSGRYVSMSTWSIKNLKEYHNLFYPSGRGQKILPIEMAQQITPLSLATWFMGDGSLHKNTCSITVGKDVDIFPAIKVINEKFGEMFKATRYEKQWTIVILDPREFVKMVGPYIISDMQYKIPEQYRHFCSQNKIFDEFNKFIISNSNIDADFLKILYEWNYDKGGEYSFKSSEHKKICKEPVQFMFKVEEIKNIGSDVDIFEMTSDLFKILPIEEQQKCVLNAFSHYRKTGFPYIYCSKDRLIKIGKNLCKYKPLVENGMLKHCSTGVNFCEHFFPHIYEAARHDVKSPIDMWNNDILLKKFLHNRFLYSGKFDDAAIRRGLKIRGSISNFKPSVAQFVYKNYMPDGGVTYDFSAGYGGRLLGFMSSGKKGHYIGVDPIFKNCLSLKSMHKFWLESIDNSCRATFLNACSETVKLPKESVNLCFSCPPYFDLERYSKDNSQSYKKYPIYSDWLQNFWSVMVENCFEMLKTGGFLIYVLGNYSHYNLIEDFQQICECKGFIKQEEIKIPLSTLFMKKSTKNLYKYEIMTIFKKF
jgi:LAGLIDADG DNA endonuclease family